MREARGQQRQRGTGDDGLRDDGQAGGAGEGDEGGGLVHSEGGRELREALRSRGAGHLLALRLGEAQREGRGQEVWGGRDHGKQTRCIYSSGISGFRE